MLTLLNTNLYFFLLFPSLLTPPHISSCLFCIYILHTTLMFDTLDYIATAFFLPGNSEQAQQHRFIILSVSKFIYPLSSELGPYTEKLLCVASLDCSVEFSAMVFWEIILKWTVVQCLEKVCLFLLPQNKQLYVFPWSCPSNQLVWSSLKQTWWQMDN